MGLAEKLATKVRTRPDLQPIRVQGPWENNGELIAAAVIRGVSIALTRQGLTSSRFRGHDTLGIGSMLGASTSRVWFEQTGSDRWDITLGAETANYGKAIDWTLRFRSQNDPDGYKMEITTPAVLTKGGSQVNKHSYSEAKDLVATGLARGSSPDPSVERSATQKSARFRPKVVLGVREGAGSGTWYVRTRLSVEEIEPRLRLLPYDVERLSGLEWQVTVGLEDDPKQRLVMLRIDGDAVQRTIGVSYSLEVGDDVVYDTCAVKQAAGLPGLLLSLMLPLDPEAMFERCDG
jgi:hypothetical protein